MDIYFLFYLFIFEWLFWLIQYDYKIIMSIVINKLHTIK